MVGVPGKSKGCSTCRRRKKGCDQKRPICGQCASSGYICGGYERQRTFIIHPASKAVEKAIFISRKNYFAGSLSRSLDQSAITSQCKSLFWDLYMPRGDCEVRDEMILRCGHPMNWALIANELPGDEPSLDHAFSALSISRVGQENGDDRLVRESTKAYGKALKDLQSALYDPARMHSDQVLTAIMLLGLYEAFENSILHSKTWITHAEGAARLIELRGPRRHQNRQAHNVFLGSRIPTIYAAIHQRRHTYLAAREWLTLPWECQPRTYLDRLVDMATAIPGLLERVDATDLPEVSDLVQAKRLQLLQEIKTIQEGLEHWRENMKKSAAPQYRKKQMSDDGDSHPFDTEIRLANHMFVNAFMFYLACSLVLSRTFNHLQDVIQSSNRRTVQYPSSIDPSDRLDASKYAADIVRTIPYCVQADMGALGSTIIHFPANLVYRHFKELNEVSITNWLAKLCAGIDYRGFQYKQSSISTSLNFNDSEGSANVSFDQNNTRSTSTKSESTTEDSSDTEFPAKPHLRSADASTVFVYEDPSKYYEDTTDQY